MSELPEPLTPPDCDLRGLEYMPLLGQHLFGSEFNARANDSEWRAALTLWWAAWTQMPAASLPDDDIALCRLADLGRDVKTWRKIKDMALYGFVKCSDGRLYHPTVAKQAMLAWDKRVKERERKAQWRAKKLGHEQGQDADVPRDRTRTEQSRDADVPADVTRRDGTLKKEEAASCAPTREPGRPIMLGGNEIPFSDALHRTFQSANIVRPPSDDDRKHLRRWIDAGADLQVDVLDVAARIARREEERGKTIGMLKYLDGPVHESIEEGRREREHLREVGERYAHLPKPVAAQGVH